MGTEAPDVAEMKLPTLWLRLALVGLVGCGEAYRYIESGPVGWQLKREVRDRGATTIPLANFTRFEWDEVFLFDPYTPRGVVCAALEVAERECEGEITAESRDDGVMFIAFRRNGTLVHAEMHFREHGDFTPVPRAQPIRKTDAVFRVLRTGGFHKLVLQSEASRSSPAPTP